MCSTCAAILACPGLPVTAKPRAARMRRRARFRSGAGLIERAAQVGEALVVHRLKASSTGFKRVLDVGSPRNEWARAGDRNATNRRQVRRPREVDHAMLAGVRQIQWIIRIAFDHTLWRVPTMPRLKAWPARLSRLQPLQPARASPRAACHPQLCRRRAGAPAVEEAEAQSKPALDQFHRRPNRPRFHRESRR